MEIREWLESLKKRGMQLGLESTKILLSNLGNPEKKFPAIHVAGSNGKGSCCYIMAKMMKYNSKKKVGLFTSPHLCHIEERIRINGKLIQPAYFDKILRKIKSAVESLPEIKPTFYEVTFVAAMLAFAEQKIEWAIVETGLGGRLDATRLVQAEACVLTTISLEHTDVLGDSLEEIAAEKAAIVPEGIPLVAVWNDSETVRKVIEDSISNHGLGFWYDPVTSFFFNFGVDPREHEVGTIMPPEEQLKLASEDYKQEGLFYRPTFLRSFLTDALLISHFVTYELLRMKPDLENLEKRIDNFLEFPGRMQEIMIDKYKNPLRLIVDSAHNPSGMNRAFLEIQERYRDNFARYILLGSSPQNNLNNFLDPIIEYCINNEEVTLILTEPEGGRYNPIEAEVLAKEIKKQLPQANIVIRKTAHSAVEELLNEWDNYSSTKEKYEGFAICIGSLYLAGNVLSSLRKDSFEDFSF